MSEKGLKRYNYLIAETNSAYHDLALKLGLSDSAMQILYTVCDYGDGSFCPLHEICRRTGISKQTINSAVRKFEKDGILYLRPADGKNKDVCLTPKGKLLAERTAMKVIEIENSVLNAWTKEELETYLALTEKFLTDFKNRKETLK